MDNSAIQIIKRFNMIPKEPEKFLDSFEDLEDPRIERKKMYPIGEILLLTLTAVICGSEGWLDIEAFGREIDWLLATIFTLCQWHTQRRYLKTIFSQD